MERTQLRRNQLMFERLLIWVDLSSPQGAARDLAPLEDENRRTREWPGWATARTGWGWVGEPPDPGACDFAASR